MLERHHGCQPFALAGSWPAVYVVADRSHTRALSWRLALQAAMAGKSFDRARLHRRLSALDAC
eukprot:6248814-Prorocentrum_lima.AAC.1